MIERGFLHREPGVNPRQSKLPEPDFNEFRKISSREYKIIAVNRKKDLTHM